MIKIKFPLWKTLCLIGVVSLSTATFSCSQKQEKYTTVFNIKDDSNIINKNVIEIIDKKLVSGLKFQNPSKQLQSIVITDSKYNGLLDEGAYFKRSNEIIINTQYLRKLRFNLDEDKAEYLYELIFHEYNHFLNNTFLNNVLPKSINLSPNIYRDYFQKSSRKTRKLENWNKNFVSAFKHELNYDVDHSHYDATEIKPGYVSIGSIYNQKELFDLANNSSHPSYPLLKGKNPVMAPHNPKVLVDNKHIIKGDDLSYLFSLQELVARKLQLVNMQYKASYSFDKNGWMHLANGERKQSPYLQDIVNFKRELNSNQGQYLNDVPTKNLASIYKAYVGNNSEINFLDFKNDIHLTKRGTYSGKINRQKIIFGGKLRSKRYEYLGYLDGLKFVNIPISIRGDSYSLKEYVNVNEVKNKLLYFAKNALGDSIVKLETVRSGKFGKTTTYENWFPNTLNNFEAIVQNGVLIKELI